MLFEVGDCLLGREEFAPITNVVGEDASFFEIVDGESNDSGVGDGFCAGGSEILANLDLCPEIGERLVGVPLAGEIF